MKGPNSPCHPSSSGNLGAPEGQSPFFSQPTEGRFASSPLPSTGPGLSGQAPRVDYRKWLLGHAAHGALAPAPLP
ncbi:hypothetical protein LIER_37021 [Lithospermum erythrorhizon]|uniref:Uncharacterized protein n=1 Tax=Lithospermum erythrorhizon TaxID=34254 RepID=A0AAV3PI94_LITER